MAHVNSTINKRYIIRAKLNELLKKLFGNDYTLKERGDVLSLAAARKLTDEEIASVSSTE